MWPSGAEDALYLLHVDGSEDEVHVYSFSDRDVRRVTQIRAITDEHLIVMLAGGFWFLLWGCVCVCMCVLPLSWWETKSSQSLLKEYIYMHICSLYIFVDLWLYLLHLRKFAVPFSMYMNDTTPVFSVQYVDIKLWSSWNHVECPINVNTIF